jgi:hypothetical protein
MRAHQSIASIEIVPPGARITIRSTAHRPRGKVDLANLAFIGEAISGDEVTSFDVQPSVVPLDD